jgi:hypothetical protein
MNARMDSSKNVGDNVILLDINWRREKMIGIVNIYIQRARGTGERPVRRPNWYIIITQGGGSMVLMGNFNATNRYWNLRCTEWMAAACGEAMTDDHELLSGTDGLPTEYWMWNTHEGKSIIDITLANRPGGSCTILDGNHSTGSEHDIIQWKLVMVKQE